MVLDGVGLTATVVASRTLPLHVLEAVLASSVAVAGALSALFLGEAMGRARWLALGVLVGALLLLAGTGEHVTGHPSETVAALPVGLLMLGLLMLAVGLSWHVRRLDCRWAPLAMGILSGTAFGMVALTGRMLPPPSAPPGPGDVLYGVIVVGWVALGLLLFGTGVHRGDTVTVVVGQILGESVLPPALAIAMGDVWSDGSAAVVAVGVLAALGSAVVIGVPRRAVASRWAPPPRPLAPGRAARPRPSPGLRPARVEW